MKTCCLYFFVFLFTICAHSQEPITTNQDNICPPELEHYESLCMAISERQKDPLGEYKNNYTRIIYEAACVDKNDSKEEIVRKIQEMWKKNRDILTCSNMTSPVENGNVVKYAISHRNLQFIHDVTRIWKVDLNYVDQADQLTTLDYVEKQIKSSEGDARLSSWVEVLKSYYYLLRYAGGKHKREL